MPSLASSFEWFLRMMREHEEFEVKTDRAGEPPFSFWSETVRRVVVGVSCPYISSHQVPPTGSKRLNRLPARKA